VSYRCDARLVPRALHSASVVSSAYGNVDTLSKLGILGPTRMDYPGTMSSVVAVARYLGRILGNK